MIDEKIEELWTTTGHPKHLYETTLGRPVDAELIQTCLRGGRLSKMPAEGVAHYLNVLAGIFDEA